MKRKILVLALLLLLVLTLIPTTISTLLTTSASPDTGWTLVTDARAMKAYSDLREYAWQKNASMAPNGPYDKIGLVRVVNPNITPKGVVFVTNCPTWGTGTERITNPPTDTWTKYENFSQAIYWANRGFDVYAIDYRAHFVPNNLNANQLGFEANWTWDVWVSDIKEAADQVLAVSGASKFFISGECTGGEAALNFATKYPQYLNGIITEDMNFVGVTGYPIIGTPITTNTYNLTQAIANMTATSNYSPMSFFTLMNVSSYALQNPGAPAQYPPGTPLQPLVNPLTNQTWTNITQWYAYTVQNIPGYPPGLFTNINGGYGNVTQFEYCIANVEAIPQRLYLENSAMADWVNCPYMSYDYNDHYKDIKVPILSFEAGNFANSTGKFQFVNGTASTDFTGIVLKNYGHLDLFFGTYSSRDVSQPALDWMVNHLPPDPTLFGNKAVGTLYDQNDANAQSVSYFTCTKPGQVTDIKAYIAGASAGNCIAAVYAVDGGSAGALLAQSNPVSINTTFSWVDFKLPTPCKVSAGTTYGLAIMGDVAVNVMEVGGTGKRDHNAASSYANGFANPFGSIWGTDDRGAMSIYAVNSNNQIINYGTGSLVYLNLPTPSNATSPPAAPGTLSHPTDIQLRCYHFDQDSSFGAFDAILVYLWMPQRNSYNPVAFITDTSNPETYQGVWNQTFIWYNPTSGANDTHNVIQVADNDLQIYTEQSSNAFIVNLTKAVTIKLPFNAWTGSAQTYGNLTFTLAPMTLKFRPIAEAYSDTGPNALLPSGYYRQPLAGMRTPAWVEETIPTWLGSTSPLEVVGHIDYKFTEIITPPKA